MKNKVCLVLIFVLVLVNQITSYSNSHKLIILDQNKSDKFIEENKMLSLINNKDSVSSIIKTKYPDSVLSTIYSDVSIMKYRPECIRRNGDFVYIVFQSESDNYLLLLFDINSDSHYPIERWYIKHCASNKDFESVVIGKTLLSEVQKIDEFGWYNLSMSAVPAISEHHTIEGNKLVISYEIDSGNNIVVSEIKSSKSELMQCLLPIDDFIIVSRGRFETTEKVCKTNEIIEELKRMDVTTMTAIDTMNELYRLLLKAKEI